jgi:hypothetical protein
MLSMKWPVLEKHGKIIFISLTTFQTTETNRRKIIMLEIINILFFRLTCAAEKTK